MTTKTGLTENGENVLMKILFFFAQQNSVGSKCILYFRVNKGVNRIAIPTWQRSRVSPDPIFSNRVTFVPERVPRPYRPSPVPIVKGCERALNILKNRFHRCVG